VNAGVAWAPLGDLVCASQAASVEWSFSNSTGVRQPKAVASLPVVEDLQVLKDRVGELHAVFHRRRSSSSVCNRSQRTRGRVESIGQRWQNSGFVPRGDL
jgi:hypothetical protein